MIKRLRRKFVIINMSLLSVVLILVFIVLCVTTYSKLRSDTEGAMVRALTQGDGPGGVIKPEIGSQNRGMDGNIPTFFVKLDSDGSIIDSNYELVTVTQEVVRQAVDLALGSQEKSGVINSLGLRFMIDVTPFGEYQVAFADTSAEVTGMQRLIWNSLLIGGGGLIAFFLISLFLATLAIKPVQTAWNQQQQFIADASHELKTPLTVILANVGILQSHPGDSISKHMRWVENTLQEASRMKSLVENLLYLARGNDQSAPLIKSEVNLSDLVWSALLSFEPVAFESGVEFDSDILPDIAIEGNHEQLRQMLDVLLDNSVKYAGEGGRAAVKLFETPTHAIMKVKNTGESIPQEHQSRIFDRFYRVDESRAHTQGSFGLGLSIAKQIADDHDAKIWVDSSAGEGTTFSIQFRLPAG